MGNRIFTAVVLLLWAATMSWLVVAKILPPFLQGEPPNLRTLLREQVVCWRIKCGDEALGWAVSQVIPSALDTTEIHSRVILDDLPLREMAPRWMSSIVDNVGSIRLDIRNRVALDSLDNLSSFDTKVRLNDMPGVIKMFGRVEDSQLLVRIQSGEIVHEVQYPAPRKSLLGGELTPDAKLPRMYKGRKWRKEVYSPFRTPNSSVELVQAEVLGDDQILHEGRVTPTKKVEYRSLSSAGVAADDTLRATLWVAEDGSGTVLRQDVHLMNVKLRFDRRQDAKSIHLATRLLDLKTVATTVSN